MITAAAIGRQIHGSATNRMRLSAYSAEAGVVERRDRVEHAQIGGPAERLAVAVGEPPGSEHGGRDRLDDQADPQRRPARTGGRRPARAPWSRPAGSAAGRSPSRRATSRPSSEASVMIPNPPIWISTRITTSPNPDQ